jgi:hypothetical protein
MWVPVLLVALYTGFVFWQRNPEWPFGRRALAHTQSDPMAAYGNTVKILNFYGPREILPGNQARICYGVVNATGGATGSSGRAIVAGVKPMFRGKAS